MQLAKSIMLKKTGSVKIAFSLLLLNVSLAVFGQYNSPYSRFGLGDLTPSSNINTRGMGGISAAYSDVISVNFNNPATYSQFQTFLEQRSKRVSQARVVLDVGVNIANRTLIAPNTAERFSTTDLLFSYVQVGLPIRKNWGMSFGIRPLSRIGYTINRSEVLFDPITNQRIDSSLTQFRGSGGSYLPSIGTGFGQNIGKNSVISAGFNVGYLFGNRENTTLRSLINDTILYYSSDHTTKTSFGKLFFNAGLLFTDTISRGKNYTVLKVGVSGNWRQTLNASQDVLRQTFTRGSANEILQIDSVYQNDGVKGEIVYPASYKAGFTLQRTNENLSGWLIGADFTQNKWSQFRNYGQMDSVQDNWMLSVGGQFSPRPRANFFSRVAYRFGFFTGPDYIKVQNKLPQLGFSFGMGLPVANYNPLSRGQYTQINVALEYGKRGNNDNLLKENLFRVSVGLNFTDLWFGKRKYD